MDAESLKKVGGIGIFTADHGEELWEQNTVLDYQFLGQYGSIIDLGLRGSQTAAPGVAHPGSCWKL